MLLVRERSDVWPGDCAEDNERECRIRDDPSESATLQPELKQEHQGDRQQRYDEREGLGEIGQAEKEAHQRSVDQALGRECIEQHRERQQHERLQQRIRANQTHR